MLKVKPISYEELIREADKYERQPVTVRAHYFQRDGTGNTFLLGDHYSDPDWAQVVFDARFLEESSPEALADIKRILERTHARWEGSIKIVAGEERRIVVSGWLELVSCDEAELVDNKDRLLSDFIKMTCWKYRFVVTCVHSLVNISKEEQEKLWLQDETEVEEARSRLSE